MIPFLVQEDYKKNEKCYPYPLILPTCEKSMWSLKLMIFENDKNYRLEILIVYAQNKFVYAHGFNFFSIGIKFLIFFFFLSICAFQIYAKFLISRARDKTQNERYAWKFNRLYQDIQLFRYQICVKFFFSENFFFYQSKIYPNFKQNSLFSVPTWLCNNLATPTVHKPIWALLCNKLSWCPWSCTHMPLNVCAKKLWDLKRHVLQRRVNFPNFPTL